ncbi:sodium:proton antiporter [Mycobacterium intermedium]|uniref:Sodium:proton antiporter n=1 Tax=Mycobacterium intermedium TaxID=28445 RepID=A0A1E3SB32_MYCIE|nr:monovalent cation/H(+) antiporter subunit G [Mycobacterium intermedium]MCV6967436.1 monovalent cation/H(+) antiporter subunit G [Mycobacterium intermedium]ODQ99343.1 sodium:proton antiporter [Mycobacterium intermedium]OPE50010.1 sodium:proton antiporter [Mycobacterium intermedium]ORB07801.1 sodium:proton antiporter [Mycobacterium intermedium]
MISLLLDILGAALLLVGLVLLTISVYGILRMPTTQSQLHAQGLATGPGVIAVLASSIATKNASIIAIATLAIVFVVLTSPTSGHAIARSARHRHESAAPEDDSPDRPE